MGLEDYVMDRLGWRFLWPCLPNSSANFCWVCCSMLIVEPLFRRYNKVPNSGIGTKVTKWSQFCLQVPNSPKWVNSRYLNHPSVGLLLTAVRPVVQNVCVPPPTRFWPKVPSQKARNRDKVEFATKVRKSNINCCLTMNIKKAFYTSLFSV